MRITELIDKVDVLDYRIEEDFDVKGIATHSRDVLRHFLFFAIKGSRDDGIKYVSEVIGKGGAVITDRDVSKILKSGSYIRVSDITDAMNIVVPRFYNYPCEKMKMIGITGTNGKSSTTFLIESISKISGLKTGVIGTINYRYDSFVLPAPNTTPDPLVLNRVLSDMSKSGVELVVMEVSSHGLALKRTASLKFDVVIFTNLSRDHLDFHKDMEEYFNAKRLLFSKDYSRNESSIAIVNVDDEYGRRLLNESFPKVFGYSLKNKDAFVYCKEYDIEEDNIKAELCIDNKSLYIESNLIGLHNLYNIMAAAGAMYLQGIKLEDISKGIKKLEFVPGRLQKVKNNLGIRCLVDYAHTDDALKNVLSSLKKLRHKRIITVFGAGGDRDRGKRPLMASAACMYSDFIIITNDNPRTEDPMRIISDIESGMDKGFIKITDISSYKKECKAYTIIPDRADAIRRAIFMAENGDIILIAGKGHEDYIIEGSQKRHFSDLEEAEKAFEERGDK